MLRISIICLVILFSLPAFSEIQSEKRLTLSLKETILLAIRENPNVQRAQLNHVQQKFALDVAKWQFKPHFSIGGTAGYNRSIIGGEDVTISKGIGLQPKMTWQSPVGTQVTVTSSNNLNNKFYPGMSVQVEQPLIRGFGRAVVEASLYNAMDTEKISRLTVENVLRSTVTAVINAYLGVILAENTLKIDEQALKRARVSVDQTKIFIKAGRKAGVELVTVEADVANAQTKLENDKNSLDQARYALLTAIGIDPNTRVKFTSIDVPILTQKFHVPPLAETKHLTLQNDIQYQIDQITIQGATKRAVVTAEDNTRWQLNLEANASLGNGAQKNSGFDNLINGAYQSQGLSLNLTIPIDDRNAKFAVASAKNALRTALIALREEKWAKETNAINGWNTIASAERALRFAEDAERLQEKTYQISFQKYSYGLIDSIELQTAHQQLSLRQQSLLDARIAYLKALVNLDQQIGKTLRTWNIQVRYW